MFLGARRLDIGTAQPGYLLGDVRPAAMESSLEEEYSQDARQLLCLSYS